MSETLWILEDSARYPAVFDWRGPVPANEIERALREGGVRAPEELVQIYGEFDSLFEWYRTLRDELGQSYGILD